MEMLYGYGAIWASTVLDSPIGPTQLGEGGGLEYQ